MTTQQITELDNHVKFISKLLNNKIIRINARYGLLGDEVEIRMCWVNKPKSPWVTVVTVSVDFLEHSSLKDLFNMLRPHLTQVIMHEYRNNSSKFISILTDAIYNRLNRISQ